MRKDKSIHTGADIFPVFFTAVMTLVTLIGLIATYSHGAAALTTLTESERAALSTAIDFESADYSKNTVPDRSSIYGSISTKDRVLLFDSATTACDLPPTYASLIGMSSPEATRYVADNYQDQLFSASYSPLRGFIPDDNAALTLTISGQLQETMYTYLTESGVKGSLFAYNYDTGDIYCMVSTPGASFSDTAAEEGSWINKCLYNTTPGSTMKLVTFYLLEQQGLHPEDLTFTCNGSYTLKYGGEAVNCTGVHGSIDGVTALGKSCNCFFAQAIECLDPVQAARDLISLGFFVNESGSASLGQLSRSGSTVNLSDAWDFSSVFSLIGQDATLVSPIDMAEIAAQYATGGKAAAPRLMLNDAQTAVVFSPNQEETFSALDRLWRSAYSEHYGSAYSDLITAAKTGTCDELGSDNRTQKLLCGYSEPLHTAFYIVIENAVTADGKLAVSTADIANMLLQQIQSIGLG